MQRSTKPLVPMVFETQFASHHRANTNKHLSTETITTRYDRSAEKRGTLDPPKSRLHSASPVVTGFHHRRRSSTSVSPLRLAREDSSEASKAQGSTSGLVAGSLAHPTSTLAPIPGTPADPKASPMSLSRSPSPLPGGGWSSPGLTPGSGSSSPRYAPRSPGLHQPDSPSWAAAKAKSEQVRSYPSFSTRNTGFFSRQKRKISASLPRFALSHDYSEQEKLNRGRSWPKGDGTLKGRLLALAAYMAHKRRAKILSFVVLVFILYLSCWSAIVQSFRASSFGGGKKVVMLIASNVEGGVMEWKGAREWAIERVSLSNKRKYAKKWGHEMEILNMVAKKRYAHEWRESWEKVDFIREAMKKYPNAEWFWWLDLNTYIMEYSYSLNSHILNHLNTNAYRDINYYNPLNITHPPIDPYLDPVSLSPTGDSDPSSINLILSQACDGFSLGSFLIRRSEWTDRLLDVWWDPVLYEQKHMDWEHKEEDAIEYLYEHQPWIRSNTAFLPQRQFNSFAPGECGNATEGIHYQEKGRDFVINLAGCKSRDCWTEIYWYRELSNWLNRNSWEIFKDTTADVFNRLRGQKTRYENHHKYMDM